MQLQAHPLAVHVIVPSEAGGGQLRLQLRYTPARRLVTACAGEAADDVALRRLYEGDAGLAVPNEAAHLAAGGELIWDPARPDRPYRCACMPCCVVHGSFSKHLHGDYACAPGAMLLHACQ